METQATTKLGELAQQFLKSDEELMKEVEESKKDSLTAELMGSDEEELALARSTNYKMAVRKAITEGASGYKSQSKRHSHYMNGVSDEGAEALEGFPFEGFQSKVAATVIEKKAMSDKQFDILFEQIEK